MTRREEKRLLEACKSAMIQAQLRIADAVYREPSRAFEEIRVPGKGPGHVTTRIDLQAQAEAERVLRESGLPLKVLGEETPLGLAIDLRRESLPVVVVDMIDGTDLLTRELGNWCSAMVAFHPPTAEILGALVGLPLGDQLKLFTAARSYAGAYRYSYEVLSTRTGLRYMLPEDSARAVVRLKPQAYAAPPARPLDGTSVCFYGQKRTRLLHLRDRTQFPWHPSLARSDRMRVYTLAGNPMLAKLAEGRVSAVFEPKGQRPHDCVPGLFIAEKAGAALAGMDGRPLDLGRALRDGGDLRYVAACDARLLRELGPLVAWLGSARRLPSPRPMNAPRGFALVYLSTSLEVCERRDPMGLYARARAGLFPAFTGVSNTCEPPDEFVDEVLNKLPEP